MNITSSDPLAATVARRHRPSEAGFIRKGCFGCLAGLAFLVFFALVLGGVSFFSRSTPSYEEESTSLTLPDLAPETERVLAGAAGDDPAEAGPSTVRPGSRDLPSLELPDRPVEIRLDLAYGSFRIEPAPPGEPIRIEADYDRANFELEETFDRDQRVYRIRFGDKGFGRNLIQVGGNRNRVTIFLPRGYPMSLTGEVATGESRLELGGLWLSEIDLEAGVGSHRMDFSEPLELPADRFLLDGSVGDLRIRGLGNASPRTVRVSHSVGDLDLNLEGRWRTSSEVRVRCKIGNCEVNPPSDVPYRIRRAKVALGESRSEPSELSPDEAEEGTPLVEIWVEHKLGDLQVR